MPYALTMPSSNKFTFSVGLALRICSREYRNLSLTTSILPRTATVSGSCLRPDYRYHYRYRQSGCHCRRPYEQIKAAEQAPW